ncbi:MAG: ABC transporter ATP-binding protein [Bacillota bacterium]
MSGLLEIHNLTVTYGSQGRLAPAVRALDLTVGEGEKLAIVGESGAGKSTLANTIMGLLPNSAEIKGEIFFSGIKISPRILAEIRGKEIVLIPQNVYNSLNPVLSIGNQMEDLLVEAKVPPDQRKNTILNWLRSVRLPRPEAIPGSYPHQLSGGMKQRVLLAMGLSRSPSLILADEPTKGLDPVRRMGILHLLKQLIEHQRQSLILITHDIKAAVFLSDTIAIMYQGEIVEIIPATRLYHHSLHPYTMALLAAAPERGLQVPCRINPGVSSYPLTGCSYAAFCNLCRPTCLQQKPALRKVAFGHMVRCNVIA